VVAHQPGEDQESVKSIAGVVALVLVAASAAAEPTGFTGRLLERVACKADPTQTYALYVPVAYTREKKWPVIFCFDPGARGRVPVERLQAAAEKFGCIVAGSNNSRNGPWADNLAAMQAMVADVDSHLALDGGRVYAAGLSGGARVAAEAGILGIAKGVIGCSAGFPVRPEGTPQHVPFLFFGTAGTEDFNHSELQRLDADLDDRHAVHRIVFFDGGHEWASPALLEEAVAWLEIQSMRRGARPRDDAMIQTSWQSRLVAAQALGPGPAWRALKSVAADFHGLADTTDVEQKVKTLSRTREVKDWQRSTERLAGREEDLVAELRTLAASGTRNEIRRRAAELRQQSEATEDSPDRQMVRRVIGGVMIGNRENLRTLFDDHAYKKAIAQLELGAALRPGQSRTLFDLARACAYAGEKQRALEGLLQAAAAGFSDAARVETDPAFGKLRTEAAFQTALAAIRANPPEPERRSREGRGH
jgi:predicted esterase